MKWEGEFTLRSDPWAGLIASCGSFYPMVWSLFSLYKSFLFRPLGSHLFCPQEFNALHICPTVLFLYFFLFFVSFGPWKINEDRSYDNAEGKDLPIGWTRLEDQFLLLFFFIIICLLFARTEITLSVKSYRSSVITTRKLVLNFLIFYPNFLELSSFQPLIVSQ